MLHASIQYKLMSCLARRLSEHLIEVVGTQSCSVGHLLQGKLLSIPSINNLFHSGQLYGVKPQ